MGNQPNLTKFCGNFGQPISPYYSRDGQMDRWLDVCKNYPLDLQDITPFDFEAAALLFP